MPISLNHTIVSAADNERAARFFATVMGLEYTGPDRHFAPVRVNESLTLDFLTVPEPPGSHLAFDVDPATPDNGRTDHPLCPRGLYFADDSENLYELMSPA